MSISQKQDLLALERELEYDSDEKGYAAMTEEVRSDGETLEEVPIEHDKRIYIVLTDCVQVCRGLRRR